MISPDGLIEKYLGTQMGKGQSACFRFCKKVLSSEFGMKMKNDYIEMLREFRPVSDPEFGDVVVMSINQPVTDHIGIYLREGAFIHCGLMDSGEVIVSRKGDGRYGSRVVCYLRHKER